MILKFATQDNVPARAWIVCVETDTIIGSRRVTSLYAAMFPGQRQALAVVADGFPSKSLIEIVGSLPQWAITRHGLVRGEVRLISALNRALGLRLRRSRGQRRNQISRIL